MTRSPRWMLLVFAVLTCVASRAPAAVPLSINYQGRVLAADGTPVPGPIDVGLSIWDAATEGTKLYQEEHPATPLSGGVFDVLIGRGSNPAGTFDAETFDAAGRWLELRIDGETLSPRQPFSSVAYALQADRAASADSVGTLMAGDIVPRSGGTYTGVVGFNGPNGNSNVLLSNLTSNPNHGFISVQNAEGAGRADVFVNAQGEGVMRTANAAGQFGALLTADDDGGTVSVSRPDGGTAALMTAGTNGGIVSAFDTAGNVGGLVSNGSAGGIVAAARAGDIGALMSLVSTGGSVSVLDNAGAVKAAMLINAGGQGRIFADVKNFVVDHPTRPGAQIVYASVEGPEAAIYCRGTVALDRGRATIELPEHFAALASPGSLTVQLTSESLDSRGLGFRRLEDGRLEVGELHGGQGSYRVHYLAHAVRRGYEDYQPVVDGGGSGSAAGDAGTSALGEVRAEAMAAARRVSALESRDQRPAD